MFIYIFAIVDGEIMPIIFSSFAQQIKESYVSIKELLEIFILDFLIPALILSQVLVVLFLQSLLHLIQQINKKVGIFIFNIVQSQLKIYKRKMQFENQPKNLRFFLLLGFKMRENTSMGESHACFNRKCIRNRSSIKSLFCMGFEINDFIRCLIVSPIYQLKFNCYLDEVNPIIFVILTTYQNIAQQDCNLQIQIEARE
ncbi:unnamed protein product [Paramecium octaurelia]|uniref:Transmembrane protein n=1 Tax=Paramecium octaurelia TaxID=43137 RepID=A0A8S1X4Q1_PAROT|nr:unnamed protein product [Paramecium octaurelia]